MTERLIGYIVKHCPCVTKAYLDNEQVFVEVSQMDFKTLSDLELSLGLKVNVGCGKHLIYEKGMEFSYKRKYAICRRDDTRTDKLANKIMNGLNGVLDYDENNPDLVISVGGDGTMLEAFHRYRNQLDSTCFLGIHTGTLGFYTNYDASECDLMIEDIIKDDLKVKDRSLIEVYLNGQFLDYALNEMRVEENRRTMVMDILLNDAFLERFRGNGICICTPAGSTGYNRSLAGSIVCTSLRSMELSEIAGIHHNQFRSLQSSLVLDERFVVTLAPHQSEHSILGIDRNVYQLNCEDVVEVRVSKKVAHFAYYRPLQLGTRLRRAFINDDQW